MKTRRESADVSHDGETLEQTRQRLQEISDLKEEWREDRENNITLFQQPCRTFHLCGMAVCQTTQSTLSNMMAHPAVLKVALPSLMAWCLLHLLPGPHQRYIQMFNFCVEYVIWWLGLGILSSVGLGNGLPTGVMFLFPHLMHTCLTAQACGTIDFKHFESIWFRTSPDLFVCPSVTATSGSSGGGELTPATFLNVWLIILIPSFIQATGTCIGEIPPYWMARAARLAAIEAGGKGESKGGDVPEELEVNSKYWIVNRVKAKMIHFLRSYGFLGVFIMAAWPNFAFDLCGICCGHFLMSFWVFFGATFLGKGCVRTVYQSLFFTALSSEKYLHMLIEVLQYLAPDSLQIDKSIHDTLHDLKLAAHHSNTATASSTLASDVSALAPKGSTSSPAVAAEASGGALETFLFLWQMLMMTVLAFFVISLIQHFAQYYQSTIDAEKEKKLTEQLTGGRHFRHTLSITSPTSGRIKLPPPTPKKRGGGGGGGGGGGSSPAPAVSSSSSSPLHQSPSSCSQGDLDEDSDRDRTHLQLFSSPMKSSYHEARMMSELEKGSSVGMTTSTTMNLDISSCSTGGVMSSDGVHMSGSGASGMVGGRDDPGDSARSGACSGGVRHGSSDDVTDAGAGAGAGAGAIGPAGSTLASVVGGYFSAVSAYRSSSAASSDNRGSKIL